MNRSRTAILTDHLRAQIADGSLPPGQKLPSEAQLITEHGVSRTVVREALGRLQAEGLIYTRRGAGSYALTPPAETTTPTARPVRTPEERLRLIEFRLAIETEGAALAAERRSQAHLQALSSELDAFSAAEGSPAQAMQHDFRFHRLLAEASSNPFLLDALDGLGSAMITMPRTRITSSPDIDEGDARKQHHGHLWTQDGKRRRAAGSRTDGTDHGGSSHVPASTPALPPSSPSAHQQATREHGQILAAVTDRDPMAAAAAMRLHLSSSRMRLFPG